MYVHARMCAYNVRDEAKKGEKIVDFGSELRKTDVTNHPEPNANNNKPCTVRSQPWWCSTRQDSILMDVLGRSKTSLSPAEQPNRCLGTETSESLIVDGTDQIFSSKEMPFTILSHPDGKCGDELPQLQHAIPIIPPSMGEYVAAPTQLETVGHSIACPSYPYADLFYRGEMATYGPQSLVHSHCLGVHPSRMALPLVTTEEPVYVNAKQYHGILRRRQSHAKAELKKKLIKPYLHESRHLHAMRRARGRRGRFLNTKKLDTDASNAVPDKGSDSTSSSLSSVGHRESKESQLQGTNMQQQQAFSNGANGSYPHHHDWFFFSKSLSLLDKMMEGDCPRQKQHERIMANQVPLRALTIK